MQLHIYKNSQQTTQSYLGTRFLAVLQSDLTTSAAERSALEQQIATLNLAIERSERQSKQESSRLQAEIQSLRQRLDRADADLLHSRRENLRLSDQVASLEKEVRIFFLLSYFHKIVHVMLININEKNRNISRISIFLA